MSGLGPGVAATGAQGLGGSKCLIGDLADVLETCLDTTPRAVPERLWVQFLLPSTEVEPRFSTFGGMLLC
jgi:hypothetical protein